MAGRPSLLDNLHPDSGHGDGLVYLTKDLDDRHDLLVATGYVNLGGLCHLADSVNESRATRLLLGAAPSAGLGAQFPATLFEQTVLALRKERDLSRFPKSRALKNLLAIKDWLDRPTSKSAGTSRSSCTVRHTSSATTTTRGPPWSPRRT